MITKYQNKYRGYIRQSLRQLGRLLIFLQKATPSGMQQNGVSIAQFSDFLVPDKFDMIVEATRSLADNKNMVSTCGFNTTPTPRAL